MKKLLILPIMALLTILMAGIGMAGGSWSINCSVNKSTIKGDFEVQARTNESGDHVKFEYLTSASGATWTLFSNDSTPAAGTGIDYNFTTGTNVSHKFLFDINTLQTRATIVNGTNSTTCTATTAATVDNSVPEIVTPSPADLTKDADGEIAFSISCKNSSSATLVEEGNSYTMTISGSAGSESCAKTVTIPTNGFHSWYVTASDGTNITTGSTVKVEVRIPGGRVTPVLGATPSPGVAPTVGGTGIENFRNFINRLLKPLFDMFDRIFKR